jgi:hypothetical protein
MVRGPFLVAIDLTIERLTGRVNLLGQLSNVKGKQLHKTSVLHNRTPEHQLIARATRSMLAVKFPLRRQRKS